MWTSPLPTNGARDGVRADAAVAHRLGGGGAPLGVARVRKGGVRGAHGAAAAAAAPRARTLRPDAAPADAAAAPPSVAFIRTHTSVAVRAMPAYTPNACATRACAAAAASSRGRKRKFSGQQRSKVAPPSALRTRARHQPS